MSRPPTPFYTDGQALQLRALTTGLWGNSPVTLRNPDGKTFRLAGHTIEQETDGRGKPVGPPRLELTIVECSPGSGLNRSSVCLAALTSGLANAASLQSLPSQTPAPTTGVSVPEVTRTPTTSPAPFDGTYPNPSRRVRATDRGVPNQNED